MHAITFDGIALEQEEVEMEEPIVSSVSKVESDPAILRPVESCVIREMVDLDNGLVNSLSTCRNTLRYHS